MAAADFVNVTIRITPVLLRDLERLAEVDPANTIRPVTRSDVIRTALAQYAAQHAAKEHVHVHQSRPAPRIRARN